MAAVFHSPIRGRRAETKAEKAARIAALKRLPDGTAVYVLIANWFPFLKVGVTSALRDRAAALKWALPGGMRLLAWWGVDGNTPRIGRLREIDMQARLDPWAVGGEWFAATPECLAVVDSLRGGLPDGPDAPVGRWAYKARRAWLAAHYAQQRGGA